MFKKKFLISVVMPVYNVEEYLAAAVNSVLQQTIGFEDNIQLILVNDASPDRSANICLEFRSRYPKNIVFLDLKRNGGVSRARNLGMDKASGEFIHFMDSDDILDTDVYEKTIAMLRQHEGEIDFAAVRVRFFEGKDGYHALDHKFTYDRVVDIGTEFSAIQLGVNSAIFRRSSIRSLRFAEEMASSEDSRFCSEVLMNNRKMKYGLIASTNYNYRQRNSGDSTIQNEVKRKGYFTTDLDGSLVYIAQRAQDLYGEVIPYFQYYILYTLGWRFRKVDKNVLNEEERAEYVEKARELIQLVDDYVIMEGKNLHKDHKLLALALKNGEEVYDEIKVWDTAVTYRNKSLFRIDSKTTMMMKQVEAAGGQITFHGHCTLPPGMKEPRFRMVDESGKEYPFKREASEDVFKAWYSYPMTSKKGYCVSVPLRKGAAYIMMMDYDGQEYRMPFNFEKVEKSSADSGAEDVFQRIVVKGQERQIVMK